jgi:mRNA interferase RelE/StbE
VPSYRVLIKYSAEKEMDALPEAIHRRISAKIVNLKDNPRPPGSQKLHGTEGYRMRAGNYRILYTVDDDSCAAMVFSVAHRREAYR